jgi:hypothetical protein
MVSSNPSELFYQYSKIVCGETDLSVKLSQTYFDIFNNEANMGAALQKLLDWFDATLKSGLKSGLESDRNPHLESQLVSLEESISKQLQKDESDRSMTLLIIKLWYLGVIAPISDPVKPLTKNGYYFHHEALIWKVASAHPAGLSGGYFGYWAYKPEN